MTLVLFLSIVLLVSSGSGTDKHNPPKYVFPIDVTWLSPLFVDVRVNSSEPMRFITDSASTYSMIRKAEADKLKLKPAGGMSLRGGGGEFNVKFTKADLEVGALKLNDVNLGVTDLPPHYAGLLGADLFENFVVTIDYEKGEVEIFDPRTFHPDSKATRIPLNIRSRIPSVEASITYGGKTVTGEFRIDTASGQPITLRHPFAEKNSFPPPGAPTQTSQSGALGGQVEWLLARADSIRIDELEFKNPIVQVYATNRGAGGGTLLAGMIGNDLLRRFRVTFDCPHKQLFLLPSSMRDMPFEVDMSGLRFGPSYQIYFVSAGSVAEKAGLKVGDVITKLDGRSITQLGLSGAHDQLMRNGKKCEIEVLRGEQIIRSILELKRLF